MDRVKFFSDNKDLSFKAYLYKTHVEYEKTKTDSLKAILTEYINDIRKTIKNAQPDVVTNLRRLKTSFTVSRVFFVILIKK